MVIDMKRMKWIAFGLSAAALLFAVAPAVAQQDGLIRDEDRTAYQAIYGEKLTSVKRTRNESDDRTLAKELMAFASGVPDDPGVQCLIYIDVLTLASNAAEMKMMAEASALLHQRWPNQDAVSPEELMQLAARGYRSVDRRDRESQGEHYINLLLDMADRLGPADDTEQATNIYRLAGTIARTISSDQEAFIENKIKQLTAASEINRRIKMLELAIQKNPQNRPVAKELVTMLVTKRNDLSAALKVVASTSDEELIDLVQQCAKGIDQANAAAALRIGDWYAALAEDERDEQALALLEQAHAWYGRFISLYSRDDALAEHVKNKNAIVKLKIGQLTKDTPASANNTGRWLPMIAPPFEAKDNLFGTGTPKRLESNQGQIIIDDGMFGIPLPKADSYEIKITMTTPNPEEEYEKRSIYVDLPIGEDRYINLHLYVKDGTVANLRHIEENLRIEDAPDRTAQKVQYTLQVSQTEGQTAVAVLYNGKLATSWKGNYEQLKERVKGDIRYLPLERGNVMAISSMTVNTIHAVEFRKRD